MYGDLGDLVSFFYLYLLCCVFGIAISNKYIMYLVRHALATELIPGPWVAVCTCVATSRTALRRTRVSPF